MANDLIPHVPFDLDLPNGEARRHVTVSEAAARHLDAWNEGQKLRALHESGHCVVAVTLGLKVKECDIKSRSGGTTMLGLGEDDEPEYKTSTQQFSEIVVGMAGLAIERLILGESTTGCESDIDHATSLAKARFDGALAPGWPVVSVAALYGEVPESLFETRAAAIIETVAKAHERADELVAEHRDQILEFARLLYSARRLADDALIAALESVGLKPVPLGA